MGEGEASVVVVLRIDCWIAVACRWHPFVLCIPFDGPSAVVVGVIGERLSEFPFEWFPHKICGGGVCFRLVVAQKCRH